MRPVLDDGKTVDILGGLVRPPPDKGACPRSVCGALGRVGGSVGQSEGRGCARRWSLCWPGLACGWAAEAGFWNSL